MKDCGDNSQTPSPIAREAWNDESMAGTYLPVSMNMKRKAHTQKEIHSHLFLRIGKYIVEISLKGCKRVLHCEENSSNDKSVQTRWLY